MNKKLFTQIKNEWHSNLWIATELLLVSVVMWYVVDYTLYHYRYCFHYKGKNSGTNLQLLPPDDGQYGSPTLLFRRRSMYHSE